jgi:hypothetical protein
VGEINNILAAFITLSEYYSIPHIIRGCLRSIFCCTSSSNDISPYSFSVLKIIFPLHPLRLCGELLRKISVNQCLSVSDCNFEVGFRFTQFTVFSDSIIHPPLPVLQQAGLLEGKVGFRYAQPNLFFMTSVVK